MFETEYFFTCPYCWENISFILDLTVSSQTYIEDCEVCCNPIEVTYSCLDGEVVAFDAQEIGQ
ncbi:CPXCG motif-containing cysteine-rich protein [Sediminitomix flava]|uniref:Cysteine-rich CPXCG n=1 Tax=Sediminitomix flava TaxID=379075 RepID=A0A315Z5L9_SEDFL|nr:CPXCG motif-containing cysteine-rich protein [Sediminitomix flava]PWJ38436.1 Cysteine-rich CPXCG [Sediminitomix flava]